MRKRNIIRRFQYDPRRQKLFANHFSLEHLRKKPICFKGSSSFIDLIITNRKAYFKKAYILQTGISDFHKLIAASLKGSSKPKVIQNLQSD